MKRILYINLDFIMYYNKTMTQIKAFSNLGYKVFLFYVRDNEICLDSFCGKIQRHLHRRKMNSKSALSKILFMQKMLTRYCEKLHITHIYMRRLMFKSILFTHFIKKQSCDKKLYYEIPTYPFDKYQDFIYDCKQNIEYWYYKNILHPYMDRTVVICQDDTLLLERMVAIENGIDMEAFPEPLTREYDRINFIGVAHLLNWHGYDRFIKSMARERKRDTFHFYIISNESTELLRLRALAIEYDVSQNITFLPAMTLQEIIAFSSQCTIGVGGVGIP